MPSDDLLVDRLRAIMTAEGVSWTEKKMFGGNCFMVDAKMCFGTYKGGLNVRVDPSNTASLLERDGAEQMMHGGRPMHGYLFVTPSGYQDDSELEHWVKACLAFNPFAKASKR